MIQGVSELTRRQEYVARWLRRAGKCSLRHARSMGMDESELNAVVAAGRAERIVERDGTDPIYRAVDKGKEWGPLPPVAGPGRVAPLAQTPYTERIRDLLSDGEPRTAGEVAGALLGGADDFVARREIAREVQRALPLLASRGIVRRLMFGTPTGHSRAGQYRYEEKYVDSKTVAPVCLICFRQYWGADAVPAQVTGRPIELCVVCKGRTYDGAYVPSTEIPIGERA